MSIKEGEMDTIHARQTIEKDGEVTVSGLPYRKGERVELTLLIQPASTSQTQQTGLTARELLHSELIGLWSKRTDIRDSTTFARQLREQAQRSFE